jgi:VanZ family protein
MLITYLCLIRINGIQRITIQHWDKYVHCLITMTLSVILFFEQTGYFRFRRSLKTIFLSTWIFPVVFMGAIELAQEYLPVPRTGDWLDFLANVAGATLGFIGNILFGKKLAGG